jgi:DNA repair exonuclease SbcCD ATPase subunit
MFKKLMKEAGQKTKLRSAEGTKIECISIGFRNFLSFGSKWQDIPLHNGVNFVTGLDLDKGKSNGAGKSSFLETIPFALFGKTARDIKQAQIINWKNKKKCEVVFRFKINESLYEIKRSLKPNKLEIYKDGALLDQDAHKTDYQSMFEQIFGMDVNMFMSLIHSNVNNSASILGMKKAEKRKFLERMFGLIIYSDMNKLCNEKLREVENKTYKLDADWSSCESQEEKSHRLVSKFLLEIKGKETDIEKVDDVENELKLLKDDNPNLDNDIEESNEEIKNKRDSFGKVTVVFEKYKSKMETEIEHLKKELKLIDDQDEQRKKNIEIQARIEKIQEKAGKIEEIEKEIEEFISKRKNLAEGIEEYNGKISLVEKDIIELEVDLRNVEKNLKLLSKGICPTCGQDVTDPKTHYKKEQTSLKKKIASRNKSLTSLKNEKSSLVSADEQIKEKHLTIGRAKDALYKLEKQLKEVGTEQEKDKLIKDKEEKIKGLEDAIKIYYEKESEHSKEVTELKSKLEGLVRKQTAIKAKEKDLDIIKSQAREIEKSIELLNRMIEEQKDEIKKCKKQQDLIQKSKFKLNDIKDYLNAIKDILKDENIKQFTIKQIMPFLNKQTNYYLSEVNYGFYVNIDKWLDVEIKGPGIRGATYESLSGGEKRGIDIAIQLSLLDVARTQAGMFPDILIFDELLDSSIDGRGINELMKIMKKIIFIFCVFFCMGFAWSPIKKGEVFKNIINIKECGDNFLIGIDSNRNNIIDTCYELEWRDGNNSKDPVLYKRHTKIWYDVYDNKILKDQGCVCDE